MFKKLYNLASLTADLEPDGPILVVQGGGSLDPVAPALAFVRTRQGEGSTVYLPGASLKGVFRAHGERLLATLLGAGAAEDPFADDEGAPRRAQAHAHRKDKRTAEVFRVSCEADRLFGSTEIAGRLRIADARPTAETTGAANRTEVRYGVAIDRAKQSVRVGPFDQEAVTAGRFRLHLTLENFDLWMLALVLQILRDLDSGLVQVGHAKSRGFGTLKVDRPALRFLVPGNPPGELQGAGAREPDVEVRERYGLADDDRVGVPPGAEAVAEGFFSGYQLGGWHTLKALETGLAPARERLVQSAAAGGGNG